MEKKQAINTQIVYDTSHNTRLDAIFKRQFKINAFNLWWLVGDLTLPCGVFNIICSCVKYYL